MTDAQREQREKALARSCGVCPVLFYILEILCYNYFRQLKENRSFFELFTVYPLIVSAERTRKGADAIQGVIFFRSKQRMKTENLTDEEFKQLLFAVKTDPRFHKTYRELQSENKYLGITKKNGKHTRLYILYTSMKMRCSEKNKGRNRKDYYEKGIRVCEEWKNSFLNFYIWAITNGYNDNLSIDRIDSNGNYEPANCRWVSMLEQQRNKSNNRFYTYNGKTQILAEWGREYNISYDRLFKRLKNGWTFEDALLIPINKNKVRKGKGK